MSRIKHVPHVLMLALLSLTIYSTCTHAYSGIFAEIEQEDLIDNSSTGEFGNIFAMTTIEVNGADRYYSAARTLYWRDSSDDGQDWNTVSAPSGFSIINGIETITAGGSDLLIASAINDSNPNLITSGLFPLDPITHSWGENQYVDDSTPPQQQSAQIINLFLLDGFSDIDRLFTVSKDGASPTYALSLYDHKETGDVADDTLITIAPSIKEIIDADVVTGASAPWLLLLDSTHIHCINDTSSAVPLYDPDSSFELRDLVNDTTTDIDTSPTDLGGIFVRTNSDNQTIYVTTGKGSIYRYIEPNSGISAGNICNSAWKNRCANANESGCWYKSQFSSSGYSYADITWFDALGQPATGGLIVGVIDSGGSVEGGYREILSDSATGDLDEISNPTGTNYQSTTLAVSTVHSFYIDGNKLFALTYGRGLWRANYSEGVPTWSWDLSR